MASLKVSSMPSALLLPLIVLLVNLGSYVCQGTPTDTSVLLGWKTQIQDPLAHLSSWVDSPSAPCTWTGILCEDDTFQVVHINLSNMSLSGSVTPIMGQLQMVKRFNVNTNNFSGEFATAMCSWKNLQFLQLRNNSFAGDLPPCLSQLQQLRVLDLSYNSFTDLPAQIGLFHQLSYLNVERSSLAGNLPPQIGNISTLISLMLGGNHLTGSIPPQLGQLQILQTIDLGYNMLEGDIPLQLGQLHHLKHLNLAVNNLTGSIPRTLGNLSHLEEVKLFANNLREKIPEEFGNLQAMRILNLSMNGLVGQIPLGLASLPALKVISLSENQLTGTVPQEFGIHSGVRALDLSSNFLVGPIPPHLCSFGKLSVLMLASNFLSGSIPTNLQMCRSLQRLSLAKNALTGTLQKEIGGLPILDYLDLSWTGLTGSLEAVDFGYSSTSLVELYLRGNHFSSRLPESFGLVPNLAKLDLSQNRFSGEIPPQLGNCTKLKELMLGENSFSGSIPAEISNSKQLEILNLSWNALIGKIPMQLGSLVNLKDLDLSNNELNETIPSQLTRVSSLELLDLSHNKLSGPVPLDGVFQTLINISLVGNTKLCGGPARTNLPACGSKKLSQRIIVITGILVVLSVTLVGFALWCSTRSVGTFHDMEGEGAPDSGEPSALGAANLSFSPSSTQQASDVSEIQLEMPNSKLDLESIGNPEDEEALTVFHHGSVAPILVEHHEAVLAPHNSPASISSDSLKHWQPPYWPWKLIFLVPDLDLTVAEVIQTCARSANLIDCRAWSGGTDMHSGMTKNGIRYVVEQPARAGKGKNLPNILRRLGQFRHPHVVKMLGYCLGRDNCLMAVLYEDLQGGNLLTALESGALSSNSLKWGSRFDIALGVVRALHYLHGHQEAYAAPLHNEITSGNILLDGGMKPYLSVRIDISELHPPRAESSEREEMLSIGCIDGTDIYNLGVVLLELLSGRQVVSPDGKHIVRWFREAVDMELSVLGMIDPTLADNPSPELIYEFYSVFHLASKCIFSNSEERPTLDEVLDYLLRLSKVRGKPPKWRPASSCNG